MSKLIEGSLATGGSIVDDAWIAIEAIDDADRSPADAALLIPLALWSAERPRWLLRSSPLGVRVGADTDPAVLAPDLERLALIAIEFPKFTDGRGYSIARLLRERHGYRGTLRAVGDVLRDQMFYLLRCGFDAFDLKHPARIDDALSAYRDFTDGYQTSVERPVPLFKRRLLADAR